MPASKQKETRDGRRVILIGMLVNVLLIAFKFIGGLYGHSQALIADAVHSISDFFTDFVALVGLEAGRRDADQKHPFGHARFETLASAVVGMSLVGVAVFLGMEAAGNIYNHTEYHPTWLALGAAALSIVIKEGLFRYTVHVARRIKSPVVMANAWHQRSDALSSVAVLIGVGGAMINPDWHVLDAYATLAVSFFIIKVGLEILWGSMRELTDTAPRQEVLDRIKECAHSVEGVMDLHDLKVRTSGGLYQMEAHILVSGTITVDQGHSIAKEVESRLKGELEDLIQIIIHVDPDSR